MDLAVDSVPMKDQSSSIKLMFKLYSNNLTYQPSQAVCPLVLAVTTPFLIEATLGCRAVHRILNASRRHSLYLYRKAPAEFRYGYSTEVLAERKNRGNIEVRRLTSENATMLSAPGGIMCFAIAKGIISNASKSHGRR